MEWKEVRLGDVCEIKGGKRLPKGLNLITQKSSHPYIRVRDLGKSKTLELNSSYEYVDEITQKQIQRYITLKGDILISIVGTIGLIAIVGGSLNGANLTENCVKLVKLDNIDSEYLYYYLKSPLGQQNISRGTVGAVQAKLPIKNIQEFNINCPVLISDQRRIASILSSLDRKIELNNKINADLEEMAQAIFKNWFVDFEPFKDGKFVDSELGMIPEGWKVVTLDDLTSKFGTGLNPRKNFVLGHGNNYYVTIKNMGNNRIYLNDRCDKVDDEALAKINKRSKLQKGDLLFSGIGTIGRVAMVVDDPINWNTSESVFNMHPIDTVSSEFIYLLLLSDKFQQYVQQNAQGGVQQGIRMASLKAFQFAIPNDLKLFDNLVKPIISKVKSNDKENDTLSLLRDTRLPRLMSGELEVPE